MTVRDIMIPRAQMDVVSIDDEPAEFMPLVLETKHSRFPVIGENKDDVVGILLAKELLNYYAQPRELRPARHAAARGVRARVEAPQRAAARLPRQPQPHRDRRRRVRRRVGPRHDRGRAGADRRRHRGRVRLRRERGQHHRRGERPLPREGADRDRRLQRALRHRLRRRRVRHRRRPRAAGVRPAAQARRDGDDRRLPLPRRARRQPPALHAAGRAGGGHAPAAAAPRRRRASADGGRRVGARARARG